MFENEDYFRDLEIHDDDIIADDNDLSGYDDVNALARHLVHDYGQCMIIELMDETNDLFHKKIVMDVLIPMMLKRVCYILNTYDVEYEYVFRTFTAGDTLFVEKVGQYNILTAGESILRKRHAFIIFYVNFPKLTYKESYYFVDSLQKSLWRTMSMESLFRNLTITEKTLDLYGSIVYNKSIASAQLKLYPGRDELLYPTLHFKRFFYNALKCFHNTQKDCAKIREMEDQIKHGVNPFLTINN